MHGLVDNVLYALGIIFEPLWIHFRLFWNNVKNSLSNTKFTLIGDDLWIDFLNPQSSKSLKTIATNMFLAKPPFQKMHWFYIRLGFGIQCFIICDPFGRHLLEVFGIDLLQRFWSICIQIGFPKSTLWRTIFDQKADFSQHCRLFFPIFFVLKAIGSSWLMLVPF